MIEFYVFYLKYLDVIQLSKMLGVVDLKITVGGGGPSGQAGAIRYAIAMALRSFVDKRTLDDMKLVGMKK